MEKELELNKQLELLEGAEVDDTIPESSANQTEEEPQDFKESFVLETPQGFKIASSSSSIRADMLADLCLNVLNHLKENPNENKKTSSYTG